MLGDVQIKKMIAKYPGFFSADSKIDGSGFEMKMCLAKYRIYRMKPQGWGGSNKSLTDFFASVDFPPSSYNTNDDLYIMFWQTE